jgi:hypothetical protein
LRINTTIDIGEDMWCLSYVAQLKNDIIMSQLDVVTGELFEEESESSDEDEETKPKEVVFDI